jgi:hypothetical protein
MFGFLEGKKLEIELEKKEFEPGEDVSGMVRVKSKKTIHAKSLKVELTYYAPNADYTEPIEKTYVSSEIMGEADYQPDSEYGFTICIPKEKPKIDYPQSEIEGMEETWQNDSALGANVMNVVATLEIPGDKNLVKFIELKVRYLK